MKNQDFFLEIVKQSPNIYQYIKFTVGTPYISAFDALGNRSAKHVTYDDVARAARRSIETKQPTLAYDNGVYCWSNGTNQVYLFIEPDLAHALWPNREPLKTEFVPMANGETLLTFPSLIHMRNTSYLHQKQKLADAARLNTQHLL